jgi:putative ABC transport system permease protein
MSELRSALRFIRTHPGFSGLVVLCLALGIGFNSTIFSVVNSALLRPLPYKDEDRLFLLPETTQGAGGGMEDYNVSYQNFMAWREQNRSFEYLEAMESTFRNLTGGKQPERVPCSVVTEGFFDLLGAKAVRGRTFLPDETKPGGPLTVVLSHAFWKQRFGGDPNVIGRAMVLDGKSHTIVGVLAPSFYFMQDADVWIPLVLDAANPPHAGTARYLFVPGRLRPGVSLSRARSEMSAIAGRLAQEHPDTNAGWSVKIVPLREKLVGDLRLALIVLLAAVGFVLLIACANVSNLLLSRVADQRNEMAIRSALGAGRFQLVRLVVTESVILALIGGAVGIALAAVALRIIPVIGPSRVALLRDVHIDWAVLLFTLVVSLLTGLLPGLLAALEGLRSDLYKDLKSGAQRSTEGVHLRRLQNGLVVGEIALALVLLICAGLMIKSFERLSRTSPGFDPHNVLLTQIALPDWKYKNVTEVRAFWRNLLPRVEALPGVVAAGITHAMPVNDNTLTTGFEVENRPPASATESLNANYRKVTPGFFRALRVSLVSGRSFNDLDDEQRPRVAIISQEMAHRFWPDADAIGKRIRRPGKATNPWLTIVGVAENVQDGVPGSKFGNTFYVPFHQDPKSANPTVNLLIRTSIPPLKVAAAVRRAVLSVDPDQPVGKITTVEDWVSSSLSKRRFSALMLTLFAVLGIVLATVGIYGVLSYTVNRRKHEIGIRMALGAQTRDVIRYVLWRGMSLTAVGLAVGLALALVLTHLFASLLYGVKATDPVTFVGIVAVLAAVALVATYLPARRAAQVDPIVSMKQE